MNNNQNNSVKARFAVDERRRRVASLLAQAKTEVEIAAELGSDQPTISRDVKALREMAQRFVFDLAKSDLAFYYRQCIDGMDMVLRKAWEMFDSDNLAPKDKLLALRVIASTNESKFTLFERGPNIMNIKALEDRLGRVEARNSSGSTNQQPI